MTVDIMFFAKYLIFAVLSALATRGRLVHVFTPCLVVYFFWSFFCRSNELVAYLLTPDRRQSKTLLQSTNAV